MTRGEKNIKIYNRISYYRCCTDSRDLVGGGFDVGAASPSVSPVSLDVAKAGLNFTSDESRILPTIVRWTQLAS